ncbi:MAG: hypothetical protein KH827_00905 [Haemophilus haemolyticus]|nr:hypothetical protein [Haemophilus haemolyticus]
MLNLPPRKEYTLNQALEYLRKFHNEDRIDKEDLLYHAKEGNLKTVVFINGGRDLYNSVRGDYFTISRINRKELTELWLLDNDVKIIENNNLNVEKEIHLSTVYALVNEYLGTWFAIPKTKRMTKYPLQNILIGKNVDDDLRKLSPINEFEFGGYFRVDPSDYGQDLQEILDSNVIYKKGYNEFEITEHSNAYFSFMLSPENTYCELPISIDDILILHDDLMDFVGLDSRLTNDPKKEIEKLKKEIEEKQKIIDSLSLINPKGRISSPQKQLFALLVKRCYSDIKSRNKLFDVINADLKSLEIRNDDISADTFYKLIDESNDIIKAIFPPKKS